jgi:predicted exporter
MLIGITVLSIWIGQRGIAIDTDLQSISPHFIQDADVEQAVTKLSANLQQNIMLVLKSNSRDNLEEALDQLAAVLPTLSVTTLSYLEPGDRLDSILNAVGNNRFYLLSNEQIQTVSELSDEQLFDRAQRRLHSISGSARLFDLTSDPLGLVSDYTLSLLENLPGGQDDIVAGGENGAEVFYAPLTFAIQPSAQDFNQQVFVLNDIHLIENTIKDYDPTLAILHSGVFFFSASAATSARADITLISTGSTIGILLLLIFFFRSIRAVLLPLVSIVVGVSFAFLCCQALFGAIHVFTIVFGASLIGVVIDYALHYAYHSSNQDTDNLIKLYQALFLSLLTSVIGYGALAFSGLQVLQQVAVFSALGLVSAWLTVLALGAILLRGQYPVYDGLLQRGIRGALVQSRGINGKVFGFMYFIIVGAAIAVVVSQVQFNDSPRGFFEPEPSLLAQEAELQKVISNYEPATYLIIRGTNEQAVYDQLDQLFLQYPEQKQVIFGIHSLMNSPQQRRMAYELNARLYDSDSIAVQFLRQLELPEEQIERLPASYRAAGAKPPSADVLFDSETLPLPPIWTQLNNDYYAFFLLSKQADLQALSNFASDKVDVFFIDTVGMSTTAIQALRQSANGLLLVALGLVSILMLVRYRRLFSIGLIAVPLTSIILTLALFTLTETSVSLFNMMALFLVLGLGMDYVIFIADLRERSQETLCAVVLSAVTSLLAFGLLSLSQLPVVHAFGLTVLIGNSINIVGSFVVARFLLPTPAN